MAANVDEGPIIHTTEIQLLDGKDRDTVTAGDIEKASREAFFASVDTCLNLVEEGFAGTPQGPPQDSRPGAVLLSDEERTVRPDMTMAEALRLFRALDGTVLRPLLNYDGRLYYAIRMSKVSGESHGDQGSQKRIGSNILQVFQGGTLKIAIRKI